MGRGGFTDVAEGNHRWTVPFKRTSTSIGLGVLGVFVLCGGVGWSSWTVGAIGLGLMAAAVGIYTISAINSRVFSFIPGTAHVVSVSEPPTSATVGRCNLHLVVNARNVPGISVKIRDAKVPVAKWPDSGADLPILVAVGDPRRVRVLWDEVETHGARANRVTVRQGGGPDIESAGGVAVEDLDVPDVFGPTTFGPYPDAVDRESPAVDLDADLGSLNIDTLGTETLDLGTVDLSTPDIDEDAVIDVDAPPGVLDEPLTEDDFREPLVAEAPAVIDNVLAPPVVDDRTAFGEPPVTGGAHRRPVADELDDVDDDDLDGDSAPGGIYVPVDPPSPPAEVIEASEIVPAPLHDDLDDDDEFAMVEVSEGRVIELDVRDVRWSNDVPTDPAGDATSTRAAGARPAAASAAAAGTTADRSTGTGSTDTGSTDTGSTDTGSTSGGTATDPEATGRSAESGSIGTEADALGESGGARRKPSPRPRKPADGTISSPPNEPTGTNSPTDSTGSTSASGPTDAASPPIPSSPTDPADPADASHPTDASHPIDTSSPTDTSHPTDTSSPTDTSHPTDIPVSDIPDTTVPLVVDRASILSPGIPAMPGPGRGDEVYDQTGDDSAATIDDYLAAAPPPDAAPPPRTISIRLLVTDLPRSIVFYRDLLGCAQLDSGRDSALLQWGDGHIVLRQVSMPIIDRRVAQLALIVPNVDEAYEDLRARGVRFELRPHVTANYERWTLWTAAFRDPDGHGILLTEWRPV
jgi:catechol 2,3-dioxygenase-like lactoylglutathione lyase family enzyme